MAQLTYEQMLNSNVEGGNNSNQIQFFSLRNDGDEAIVRFIYDNVNQFDIHTVHSVEMGNRWRSVACLRGPQDPIDKCPMCANNVQIRNRIFIYFLEYIPQEDGTFMVQPRVWERPARDYAMKLKGYLDNYGPLSNMICKIVRHGKARDMGTTYEIIPNLSKDIYPDSVFVPDFSAFKDVKALGRYVLDKDANEMIEFMRTGQFPETKKENTSTYTQPTATHADSQAYTQAPQFVPQTAPFSPMRTTEFTPTTNPVNPMPVRNPMGNTSFR